MLEKSLVGRCIFAAGLLGLSVLAMTMSQPNRANDADSETHLPFVVGSGEEFLDQIFEEEKSNRICRFIKVKKMKA